VGGSGAGVVRVLGGASLSTDVLNGITLARDPGSSAEILVRGGGSTWFDTAGVLAVGGAGEAIVRVEDGGQLTVFGLIASASGTLAGDGTVTGNVVNLGAVEVGPSSPARGGPSALTIVGDYDQFDDPADPEISGRLVVALEDVGGSPAVSRLDVTGDAQLAGGLVVENPSEVLSAGDVVDRFDVALMPGLAPGPQGEGRFLRLNYPVAVAESGATVGVRLVVDTLTGDIATDAAQSFPVTGSPSAAAAGDLNNDQLADLAVVIPSDTPGQDGSLFVFCNQGLDTNTGDWLGFSGSIEAATQVDPSGVDIGDADGAGGLDIAVSNRGSDSVSVYTNTGGSGGIALARVIAVGSAPAAVAFGDLDNDKWEDLATANESDDTISVLANPSGTPSDPWAAQVINLPAGSAPVSLVWSNIDNDKWEDLVLATVGDARARWIRGIGASSFGPGQSAPVGSGPVQVIAADLDLDGLPELVTANEAGDSVSVLRNAGLGSFAPPVELPVEGGPRSVAAVDLDGDTGNDRDLAVVADDNGSSVIKVLRNDLSGGQLIFAPATTLQAGAEPVFVLGGDVNDDGQADLVTVNDQTGVALGAESGAMPDNDVSVILRAPACEGDADGNGSVDVNDITYVVQRLGQPGPDGDADGSGAVDVNDITFVVQRLGAACG